eukprot:3572652-Pyramimonas_sp.AAC.1
MGTLCFYIPNSTPARRKKDSTGILGPVAGALPRDQPLNIMGSHGQDRETTHTKCGVDVWQVRRMSKRAAREGI